MGADRELEELARFGGFDALLVCARGDTEPVGVLPMPARLARAQGVCREPSRVAQRYPLYTKELVDE